MTRLDAETSATRMTATARRTDRLHPGYEARQLPTRNGFVWSVLDLSDHRTVLR